MVWNMDPPPRPSRRGDDQLLMRRPEVAGAGQSVDDADAERRVVVAGQSLGHQRSLTTRP